MKKKNIYIIVIAVALLFALYTGAVESGILPLGGCWNESGKFVEKFTLQKGEKREITGTNYSLVLVDIKRQDSYIGAISIELHNDSGYVEGQVLLTGSYGAYKELKKENLKIVIDKILDNQCVKFGLYLI